jgi:GrpB-like predicted nucleotidyltransferase (UPF0157 family)
MKQIRSMKTATDDTPYVVEYHPYDPRLPEVFEMVARLIQTAAGAVVVEHIGSSSIPGVGGRNVLDIAVPAAEPQQPAIRKVLYELGFEDSPFPHYLPLLVGQIAHQSKNYQILLYVVSPESSVFADWLKFRDHMRGHPEDAQAYCTTKQEAVAEAMTGGKDYQEGKSPFLASISAKLPRSVEPRK